MVQSIQNICSYKQKCVLIVLVLQHLIMGDTQCIRNGLLIGLCHSHLKVSWTELALYVRLLLLEKVDSCCQISDCLDCLEADDIILYLVTGHVAYVLNRVVWFL